MILGIYDETAEAVVYLDLEEVTGGIKLVAKDAAGNQLASLCTVSTDGTLGLNGGNNSVYFQWDQDGKIVIS